MLRGRRHFGRRVRGYEGFRAATLEPRPESLPLFVGRPHGSAYGCAGGSKRMGMPMGAHAREPVTGGDEYSAEGKSWAPRRSRRQLLIHGGNYYSDDLYLFTSNTTTTTT